MSNSNMLTGSSRRCFCDSNWMVFNLSNSLKSNGADYFVPDLFADYDHKQRCQDPSKQHNLDLLLGRSLRTYPRYYPLGQEHGCLINAGIEYVETVQIRYLNYCSRAKKVWYLKDYKYCNSLSEQLLFPKGACMCPLSHNNKFDDDD